ncbi:MAG: hypothetical protein K2W94_07870 [Alphaproteobacteria bacterium]|nr:hypothetical protein [Alphaproteobacteria bacterium]
MKNIIIFSSLLLLTIAGSLYCSDDFEGTNEGSGGRQRPFYPSSGSGSSAYPSGGSGSGAYPSDGIW